MRSTLNGKRSIVERTSVVNKFEKKPQRPVGRWSKWQIWIVASVVVAAVTSIVWWGSPTSVDPADADVVVYKSSACSCCGRWVEHLQDNGLVVSVQNVRNTQLAQSQLGVPEELRACHTAVVGRYWVEGHVPADVIRRVIGEKPDDIRGIAVPGMPMGSPGMEGAKPVEYEVLAYETAGTTRVYATRQGRAVPGTSESED